jgi:hypothetical protein
MRNLADEWARALADDLTNEPPPWLPENLVIRAATTAETLTRPAFLIHGTEDPRVHPRLAVGSITFALHWHRNDGTPAAARELLRLAALEMDTRRDTITLEGCEMTWFMPAPEEEQTVEDGFIFRAIRDVRFRAESIAQA